MANRTALLIGNQTFRPNSGLLPLRGPLNDVAALSRILGDPERGRFLVREFLDKPHHEILPDIERALGQATPGDLVLIYYSGHGKLDRNGRVCLATRDTEEGALQATSIPARYLTDLVDQSDCDQVVLVLDCCYSGAVNLKGDVGSEMHVIEDARGIYILTATTDQQVAREAQPIADGEVMGRFTAAMVEAIETGLADVGRKGRILLSDLRKHLAEVVTGQTPQFFARRASGDPLISLSPATAAPLLDVNIAMDIDNDRRKGRDLGTEKSSFSTDRRLIVVGIASILSIVVFALIYFVFSGPEPPHLIRPSFASCAPEGPSCTRIVEPKVRVYNHNYFLDYCRTYAQTCGPPLWDWYCKQWGFSKALGGDRYSGVGASYIFGDGEYVPADYVPHLKGEDFGVCTSIPDTLRCDGIMYVDCTK